MLDQCLGQMGFTYVVVFVDILTLAIVKIVVWSIHVGHFDSLDFSSIF